MKIYNTEDYKPFKPSEKGANVFWTAPRKGVGARYFTFDKMHLYNFWQEYPNALTKEQKELFDKENPYFKDWGSPR